MNFFALFFFFVALPYTAGFGLLAFLPRWRWLLLAAAAAAVFCIRIEQGMFNPEEAAAPDLDAVCLMFAEMGLISGFITRALTLSRRASPKLILPITFIAMPFVLVGMLRIRSFLL
jgi:hypothetical protein